MGSCRSAACMRENIYTYRYIFTFSFMYLFMYIYIHIHMHIHTYLHNVCMFTLMHTNVYRYMCIQMYVHIYVYIYICMRIYIYIYQLTESFRRWLSACLCNWACCEDQLRHQAPGFILLCSAVSGGTLLLRRPATANLTGDHMALNL